MNNKTEKPPLEGLPGKGRGRFETIDLIRGFAVFLMIIFHFSFDLKAFGYAEIDFQKDLLWWTFPRVIVTLFLISMGLAMEVNYKGHIRWRAIGQRLIKIGGCALAISLFTYFAFPSSWIYFGTLHCIAVCSVLALPLLGKPWWSLVTALVLLIPLSWGFRWPWIHMDHASMDYIPALPWLGVVLFGMIFYHLGLHKVQVPPFPGKKLLLLQGKHSLKIYLLHQPILFLGVKIFYTLTH